LHRNFTRRQVAIQNRVASNIGISQSTFSVKVLNLFSRSRRKTNKRKSKHSAMLRNKEDRKSGSAGMPRPISYAVFCLKKKNEDPLHRIHVEYNERPRVGTRDQAPRAQRPVLRPH